MIKLLLFVFLSLCSTACTSSESEEHRKSVAPSEAKMKWREENAFTNLFLDSVKLAKFINDNKIDDDRSGNMKDFYRSRDYQYAWFTEDGLAEHTKAFWNLHLGHVDVKLDSAASEKWLHQQMVFLLSNPQTVSLDSATMLKIELNLTDHFFRFAKTAYAGRIDPEELSWHIPQKKVDAVALLDSLIKLNGRDIEDWEPVTRQYRQMKAALLQFYEIQKRGGWPTVTIPEKTAFHLGDTAAAIATIKQRLQASGDMKGSDSSPAFTLDLLDGVKEFQRRMGLEPDGVIGQNTIASLNVPVEDRIKTIMINLERLRWMPQQPAGTFVLVNIPEFVLRVFENDKLIKKMNVVVGTEGHNTQIFSDNIEYVVFSPYWNVPKSIVRNEILPAMQKDPYYLESQNMEIVKYENGLPVVRQRPGYDNALGLVKFIFPNGYNIYLHDTPAKSLFDNNKRASSHGCIRIEDPEWMAEWLLRNQPQWTTSKILDAMNSGKEKWVKIEDPVPVLISYFTAFVTADGKANFRKDIYEHDKKMAAKLFK